MRGSRAPVTTQGVWDSWLTWTAPSSASLTTWSTQLTTVESRATEHDRYGNDLITRVAEPLKTVAQRFEDLRKRHNEHAEKLEKERDASYADLRKTKGKYDAVCQEVEAKRKKTESSYDKAKAQSSYQQQLQDMNNVKNTYLISINVINKHKEKYYHEYLPTLMNSLQDLSEFRTFKLNEFWTLGAQLERAMLEKSKGLMEHLGQEIMRNQPHLDSLMYMRHNVGSWQEPADKGFEPSPVWHDTDAMVVDEAAKVFLRNVLGKSKGHLGELRREADKKRREVEGFERQKKRVREGTEKVDEVDVVRQLFAAREMFHDVERKRVTAEVETSTITSMVGDVTLGAKNHNFKSQTFKIPTNCDLCGERIWGLSAKGFDCRDCGYTCHSKCELKVPADCPGEKSKEERKKLKAERQEAANALLSPTGPPAHVNELPDLTRSNTMTSLSSGYAASAHRSVSGPLSGQRSPVEEETPPEIPGPRPPAASPTTSTAAAAARKRVIAPPPSSYISELPGSEAVAKKTEQKGKMLYTFQANGDGELSVSEGRDVVLLEPDGRYPLKCSHYHKQAIFC